MCILSSPADARFCENGQPGDDSRQDGSGLDVDTFCYSLATPTFRSYPMTSLFDPADREALLARVAALQPAAARQWGRMDPAQMLCHCSQALETATGDRPMKQRFLGKIVTPFIRSSILGAKPFGKNAPTDPTFVVSGERDFTAERTRLTGLIHRLVERGPVAAAKETPAFFGQLSGEEGGLLMYKHIDHHLRHFAL